MSLKNKLHVDSENVAVPEIHSDGFEDKQKEADEEENKEREEKEIFYDNVAIPEIHIRRKKKNK